MRVAFLSDLHLGNHRRLGGPITCSLNKRCWDALEVLRRAIVVAIEKDCQALFILGDFFDTVNPLPQLVHEAMSILEEWLPRQLYLLRGNHETVTTTPADNSLAPLMHLDPEGLHRDCVIEDTRVVTLSRNVAVICVPYVPDLKPFLADRLLELVQGARNRLILALHCGITDQESQKFLKRTPGSIGVGDLLQACNEHQIGWVLSGHFHEHRTWRQKQDHGTVEVMQLGALVPRDFRDLGLEGYGTLAIWDSGKLTREEIPGPRFFDAASAQGVKDALLDACFDGPAVAHWRYPRVAAPAEFFDAERSVLLALKHDDVIADFDLSPTAASTKAAEQAAETGRSSQSLDRALDTCTTELSSKQAALVQQQARDYLAKSKEIHAGHISIDVRKLRLCKVLGHQGDTVLELPPSGTVVITGPNDSGKSSIPEAVATAAWGKTMRGTSPWQSAKLSVAAVELGEDCQVSRAKADASKPVLQFAHTTDTGEVISSIGCATPTIAQKRLESMVGTFGMWRRSHVLSSSDALHFSRATDGERKRLAEQVLGLDFDTALKSCRTELKAAERELAAAERERDLTTLKLQGEERRRDSAQEAINRLAEDSGETTVTKRDLRQLQKKQKAALKEVVAAQAKNTRKINGVRSELRRVDGEIGRLIATQQLQLRQADKLGSDSCPTCGQEITAVVREELLAQADRRRCAARDRTAAFQVEREDLEAKREQLGEESSQLFAKQSEINAQTSTTKLATDEAKHWAGIAAAAMKLIRRYQVDLDNHEDDIYGLQERVAVLRETERVLGLKGARALVLEDVFTSIEQAASFALSRMSMGGWLISDGGLQVRASKIQINGRDYLAYGHGVRKKVDFALALALADVTAAASGRKPGTLWLDEIDDGLYSDGRLAVAALIAELASDRCVVVITHSQEFAGALEAVERWYVQDGKVEVRDG